MAKKLEITLTSDGFSIHTFELWRNIKRKEMRSIIARLYSTANDGAPQIYPARKRKGILFCNQFSEHGIRMILHAGEGMDNGVHLIINPRKLLDPASGYLGIMPRDRESFQLLGENFTDIMRKLCLPEFFDDWNLTTLDFCVNLACSTNKLPREFIRTAQKTLPPNKYVVQRFNSNKLPQKKINQINKHYYKLQNDSIAITIYDKTYQMRAESLLVAYEKLPQGVLRAEVRYRSRYIKRAAKKYDLKGTSDIIFGLATHSREIMLKHFAACFPRATFRRPNELLCLINASEFHMETKEKMTYLVESLRRKHTVKAALTDTIQRFNMSERAAFELLERFDQIDVSPIPLRKNFKFDSLTSIPRLFEQLDDEQTDDIIYR